MPNTKTESNRKSLASIKQNYFGRIIVFALFIFVILPDMMALQLNIYIWIYILGFFILFPHIAFFAAKNSRDPQDTEERFMLFEGFCEGTLYASLAFSFMSVFSFLIVSTIYVGFYGGMKFWLKGRLCMLLGILVYTLIFGLNIQWLSATYTFYAGAVFLPLVVAGLVMNIKANFEWSRSKIRKNKEHLEALATKLAKYLSPQVYSQIFEGKKEVRLESYRKKLTIFFSDIKGFTQLTDSMESETLSSLLNSYFNEMARIALKHGGTIDKYMGDAIMIFFGDPESRGEKEDAVACVRMALEMKERLEVLRQGWENQGVSKELRIRMGINTGYCTVGNFGSDDRLDYTIVGGQVNLASRLESNAGVDQILISHETYSLIKDQVACEKKDEIMVKGIAYPVQTYQVNDLHEKLTKVNSQIKEESKGFLVSINLNQMEKEEAIRSLEKILNKMKTS